LRVAQPAALAVWQGLDEHLSVIDRIGLVPAQFGPRNGNFPLIEEYTLGDGFRLEDRAISCADGPDLESDSRASRQPDRGHRTSPWFRIPLRLNTVAEARERYRRWAEASSDATHPNRVVQHQKPNGSVGRVRDLKSKCRGGISEMTTPGEQRPPTSPPGTSGPGARHSAPVEGGRSCDRMFLKLLHELVGGGWGWRIAAAK